MSSPDIVYIGRHAWAASPYSGAYATDNQRPLTHEGERRYRSVVRGLAKQGFAPDAIACSPLLRCRQTAGIISEEIEGDIAVQPLPCLGPGARLDELLDWTVAQPVARVAWIGHAPDVSHLTRRILKGESVSLGFDQAAVAAVQFDGQALLGEGRLMWHYCAEDVEGQP